MDKSGLKTVVILLLVIVNMAFAANLLFRYFSEKAEQNALVSEAKTALNNMGIAADIAQLKADISQSVVLTADRDVETETKIAKKLTGTENRMEMGGGIAVYTGSGQCTFKSGGRMEITLPDSGLRPKNAKDAAKQVLRLLSDAGLDMNDAEYTVSENKEDGTSYTAKYKHKIAGLYVCNDVLTATLTENGALSVSGQWMTGTNAKEYSSGATSAASAVVSFAVNAQSEDIAFSGIEECTQMYYLEASGYDAITVIPVLRITAGGKYYYADAVTGKIIQ